MNTPTTVLDLIRDDAHAAGFQSLGQYRKALIEAATAAATITIGETHSPVKVRLGLRLIGDEEVAIITLTQHDRTVTLNCVDQAHAARIAEAIEGLTAAPAGQVEPEITPEMIRAGANHVTIFHSAAECAEKVYRAMRSVAPQPAEQEKFKRFNDQECWMWAGDGSDRLETLTCPVVITPADLMAIINRGSPQSDVTQLVEALEAAQKVAGCRNVHTATQARAALGCIAAICDIALAAHSEQGGGV